jgi:hypothetical protein
MSPLRNANPAVVRFRQIQVLSLGIRMLVLFVGLYLVLTYVKGV